MTKITQNNFSGGIVNDPRDTALGSARVVTNFDIITKQGSLIPYRSSEDGNSNSANDLMRNWCVALRTGTTYSLYGLGRQTATDKVRVFYKNLTTGAANDLDDNGWTETAANLGANVIGDDTRDFVLFVYYPKTGLIYGVHGGANIWTYDPTGGGFVDASQAVTYTKVCQGVIHSKDDTLYFGYYNSAGGAGAKSYIASKNGAGAWNLTALTMPDQYYPTSICEFNNYLAIGLAPISGVGNSRVFLWDRTTSLATISENIDWGYGSLKVLDEIGGYLIGISLDGNGTTRFNDRVTFRYYTGSGSISFKEILGATATELLISKQKINNRIYFAGEISLNGSVRSGVWSFGKNQNGVFNLIHERTPNNDTAITSSGINGFFYVGDYLFTSYTTAGAAGAVSKTDDSNTAYTATSIFESQINPGMPTEHKIQKKQLKAIIIGYTTLSGISGQVVVKYRVDSSSTYTTICTCTTTGINVLEFKDAAGVPFTFGRNYEFRLESTLGAEITLFEYVYDIIPTLA